MNFKQQAYVPLEQSAGVQGAKLQKNSGINSSQSKKSAKKERIFGKIAYLCSKNRKEG
jgi:hypothetical protein